MCFVFSNLDPNYSSFAIFHKEFTRLHNFPDDLDLLEEKSLVDRYGFPPTSGFFFPLHLLEQVLSLTLFLNLRLLLLIFFWMWTIFLKVFIEFITILLQLYVLVSGPRDM